MLLYQKTGKTAPIEASPSSNGNIHVDLEQGTYIILTGKELENARTRGVPLHLNHFVTCRFAQEFLKGVANEPVDDPPITGPWSNHDLISNAEGKLVHVFRSVLKAGQPKVCGRCGSALKGLLRVEADGYRCQSCNSRVCIVCGCTDERACADGNYRCYWVGPGFCSTHIKELEIALRNSEETHNDNKPA